MATNGTPYWKCPDCGMLDTTKPPGGCKDKLHAALWRSYRVRPAIPVRVKTPQASSLLTKREDGSYRPDFTPQELAVIHRDLFTAGYAPSKDHKVRKAVLDKLFAYFGNDRAHLAEK